MNMWVSDPLFGLGLAVLSSYLWGFLNGRTTKYLEHKYGW